MIVYESTKTKFLDDMLSNDIENIILTQYKLKLNRTTSPSEIAAWKNSLAYMDRILQDPGIPENCGIAIELQLPWSSKRIDFIISGFDATNSGCIIIIELKQWSEAKLTSKDGIVETFMNGASVETPHPSYQAWSYATFLEGFSEPVYSEPIGLRPCAYLHNYATDDIIHHEFYSEYLSKAPAFLKSDALKLREFIKQHVRFGDNGNVLFRIDNGKISPSKSLADKVASLMKGNKEFLMIDDQKVVYEAALALSKKSGPNNKNVMIVSGGPGTGKSVIAINLLAELTKLGLLSTYVSKNAAPRAVYESKLRGNTKTYEIRNLFSGSGSFIKTKQNTFSTLIIDEAHRLNEKGGLYGNQGENQIKEIIHSAACSIFFIDEDQRVHLNDIGEKDSIIQWAKKEGARIHEYTLESQFRCNGSSGYLSWLDDVLQIRKTANLNFKDLGFDFQIYSSPSTIREIIFEKNKENNKARMVAGYCWNWVSDGNVNLFDIEMPSFNFKMQWNLKKYGSLWMIDPKSVNEIGCIHTCQGLEADYIGVIVGPDLIVRNGTIQTNPAMRARTDQSTKRYKSYCEKHPTTGPAFVDRIIKNTYRVLMTRGMKGCYVYFTDKETEDYFRSRFKD